MGFRIITSVTLDPVWAFAGASSASWQSRDSIDQPKQLGNVMSIRRGEHHRQQSSLGRDDDVVV